MAKQFLHYDQHSLIYSTIKPCFSVVWSIEEETVGIMTSENGDSVTKSSLSKGLNLATDPLVSDLKSPMVFWNKQKKIYWRNYNAHNLHNIKHPNNIKHSNNQKPSSVESNSFKSTM